MIPLQPPVRTAGPAYPTRVHLLGDPSLRRKALTALAAAVLSGCGTTPPAPLHTGGTPPPPATPTAAPVALPGGGPAAQPQPEPHRLLGESNAPPPPQPQHLRGDSIMVAEPEPEPLRGKVRCEQAVAVPVTP